MGAAAAAALIALLVLALLPRQRAAEGTTIASTSAPSGIEERHYITLIVRKPDGVESRTYETNSFVFHDLLMVRFAWPWLYGAAHYSTFVLTTRPLKDYQGCLHDTWGEKVPYYWPPFTAAYPIYFIHTPEMPEVFGDPWPGSVVVLGSGVSPDNGCSLGSTLRVYSIPTVGYLYNDVWFNVTIAATFSFSGNVTVSEAVLLVESGPTVNVRLYTFYLPVIYDSFPPINIPAGSELTVVWTIAWKDYGAFTENWGKLWQYLLTAHAEVYITLFLRPVMNFTDSNGRICSVAFPPAGRGYEYLLPDYTVGSGPTLLRLAWGTGSSPMSRSTTRLQNETGRIIPSAGMRGGSFAIGGVVTSEAREVGLYWITYRGTWGPLPPSQACRELGIPCPPSETCEILLMRWVPPSPLPPGTPINIYVARG